MISGNAPLVPRDRWFTARGFLFRQPARRLRDYPWWPVGDAMRLLRDLVAGVNDDTPRHFDFEESELFTLLEARGDAAIGAHLTDEHTAMRPLCSDLPLLSLCLI